MKKLIKRILRRLFHRGQGQSSNIESARSIGVKIGQDCRLVGEVIWGSEPYLIEIGNRVSISNSRFVTHDGAVWVFRDKNNINIDVVDRVKLGNNIFIGLNCIILPGTIIEDNVVVGAGSIVRGVLKRNSVYAGVPARRIKGLDEYKEGIKGKTYPTKLLGRNEKREYLEQHCK